MNCPKCNSTRIQVTTEQASAKTKEKGMGCLWAIGRSLLICCTFGLWLLIGRRRGTGKTKFVNRTVCICQDCAYKWYV